MVMLTDFGLQAGCSGKPLPPQNEVPWVGVEEHHIGIPGNPDSWVSPEYTVTMHDPRTPTLRWNTTFRRYSAPPVDGSPGKCECLPALAPP